MRHDAVYYWWLDAWLLSCSGSGCSLFSYFIPLQALLIVAPSCFPFPSNIMCGFVSCGVSLSLPHHPEKKLDGRLRAQVFSVLRVVLLYFVL